VLYDLDIEAASIARASGVTMRRAATVGDHPLFIRMIAELLGRGGIADGGVSSAPQRPL
jgi:protoheme ferro-lyase